MSEAVKTDVIKPTLKVAFDNMLQTLSNEVEALPQILKEVTPEKRLDFISKTLPVLIKYKESRESDWYWGE